MMTSWSSSPAAPKAKQVSEAAHYIHAFGYHLARKMLGASLVDDVISQAYTLQQQHPAENPFHCFRANWRSNVRFPWQLPSDKDGPRGAGTGDGVDPEISPEALFVDITFDFILFPTRIVNERGAYRGHVLRKGDVGGGGGDVYIEQREGNGRKEEADSIAMAVAIRIGALVAMPSHNNKQGKKNGRSKEAYQFSYRRSENALTASDLDEHCCAIDIVLEEMDPSDVARIMGDAFLEGRRRPTWQVIAKRESGIIDADTFSNDLNAVFNFEQKPKQKTSWHLKVRYLALQADGLFLLSNNSGSNSAESIGRCTLDMLLLQSISIHDSAKYVSIPTPEARMFWKTVDPTLVKAVERPIEPSTQKISPACNVTAAAVTYSAVKDPYTVKSVPKEEKSDKADKISSKSECGEHRPPKPQENVFIARWKRTSLGGNCRKKPKFTLGA